MTDSTELRLVRRLAVIAIALPVFGGCGQKGPLYLPGNPSEIQTEVPQQETRQEPTATEPQDEDDEEDEAAEAQP